jgi:hypothetical protein
MKEIIIIITTDCCPSACYTSSCRRWKKKKKWMAVNQKPEKKGGGLWDERGKTREWDGSLLSIRERSKRVLGNCLFLWAFPTDPSVRHAQRSGWPGSMKIAVLSSRTTCSSTLSQERNGRARTLLRVKKEKERAKQRYRANRRDGQLVTSITHFIYVLWYGEPGRMNRKKKETTLRKIKKGEVVNIPVSFSLSIVLLFFFLCRNNMKIGQTRHKQRRHLLTLLPMSFILFQIKILWEYVIICNVENLLI